LFSLLVTIGDVARPIPIMETDQALKKRSRLGDPDAQFRLGYRLAFRRLPALHNWHKAAEYWQAAAGNGHTRAQFYLGVCYEHGRGVPMDLSQALRWYRKAGMGGHAAAQYNIAFSYAHGSGLPRSPTNAIRWLRRAAKQGDADWLRALLGDNFFSEADCIYCLGGLENLEEFPHLRLLRIMMANRVTDDGLKYVKGLTELQDLVFIDTEVSNAAVEDLRKALPKTYIVVLHQFPKVSRKDYPPSASASK
jgi:hypothetical protein